MLVPELGQHTPVPAREKLALGIAHHDQRMAGAEVAGVGRGATGGPEPVVAIALLKVLQVVVGKRQRRFAIRTACTGDQTQAHKIAAAQGLRVVYGQVAQQGHAVVLNLPVAQCAHLV